MLESKVIRHGDLIIFARSSTNSACTVMICVCQDLNYGYRFKNPKYLTSSSFQRLMGFDPIIDYSGGQVHWRAA